MPRHSHPADATGTAILQMPGSWEAETAPIQQQAQKYLKLCDGCLGYGNAGDLNCSGLPLNPLCLLAPMCSQQQPPEGPLGPPSMHRSSSQHWCFPGVASVCHELPRPLSTKTFSDIEGGQRDQTLLSATSVPALFPCGCSSLLSRNAECVPCFSGWGWSRLSTQVEMFHRWHQSQTST